MRYSRPSKSNILYSLIALVALVGSFVAYGATGKHPAYAAGGPQVSMGHLIVVGTTTSKSTKIDTGHEDTKLAIGPELDLSRHQIASESQPNPPTNLPNPPAKAVTSNNPGFQGFQGITHADQLLANNGNQFSVEPPDQALCVGNGFILEGVNAALAVYTTSSHTIVKPTTALNAFFNLSPEIIPGKSPSYGPFISHPKCYYDHATQRWFLTTNEVDRASQSGAFLSNSNILIAVSQTNDPTGKWTLFSINATDDGSHGTPVHSNCPCIGDQPLIGADTNGFYISTNEFALGKSHIPNGAQIYALSKSGLIAAATSSNPKLTFVQFDTTSLPLGGLPTSIQPATSPTGSGSPDNNGTEYFLSSLDVGWTIAKQIATWSLTNTASLSSTKPNLKLSFVTLTSEAYDSPPAVIQKPGPRPLADSIRAQTHVNPPLEALDSNDDRINQVVFANGLLWSGLNTIVQAPKAVVRAAIAYFLVKPGSNGGNLVATIVTQGYVAVDKNSVMFPSIGVTVAGKGVMSFTLVGPNYFPSAAYTPIDAVNGAGEVHIAAMGAAPEDGFSGYKAYGGYGLAHWGYYSSAVDDNGTVWLAAEYIPNAPRSPLANWGTFISQVNL